MLKVDRRVHVAPAQLGLGPPQHALRRRVHEGDAAVRIQRVRTLTQVVRDGPQEVGQALASNVGHERRTAQGVVHHRAAGRCHWRGWHGWLVCHVRRSSSESRDLQDES